jgi:antitoxin ParD1/3/4
MNVNLGPTLDKFVAEMLRSGLYQSQSEVLREALRLLKEREQAKKAELERLRREIAIGTEQAERGELFDGEAVFTQLLKGGRARTRAKR